MKRVSCGSLTLMLLIGLLVFCVEPAAGATRKADPIVLQAVTCLEPTQERMQVKLKLVDLINELAKGELIIKIVGGPSAIASREQPMAVKRGQIDMAITFTAFYEGIVPVGQVLTISRVSMKEERERGALTYLQKLHEEQGLFLLGRTNCIREPVFYVSTMRAVQKPEDFNGLRAGITSTVFDAFCRALGMTSNFVRFADLYTALERGMIDTIPLTLDTMLQYGLAEMKGLMTVDHPFYLSNNVTLINLDKWKTLPKHLKDLILKAQLEFEPQNEKVEAAFANRYKQKFMDAGIKFIQFSPSDAKRFVDLAYSAQWQKLLKEQPETVTKLKSMLSK